MIALALNAALTDVAIAAIPVLMALWAVCALMVARSQARQQRILTRWAEHNERVSAVLAAELARQDAATLARLRAQLETQPQPFILSLSTDAASGGAVRASSPTARFRVAVARVRARGEKPDDLTPLTWFLEGEYSARTDVDLSEIRDA